MINAADEDDVVACLFLYFLGDLSIGPNHPFFLSSSSIISNSNLDFSCFIFLPLLLLLFSFHFRLGGLFCMHFSLVLLDQVGERGGRS
ncbi:hypothetical protein B0H66DRAFT_210441 [Apodospora peruviana]|uniref:Uncharacterized protein n=1 Tax=Apodospora peruviana TaxID=516989 RepID=A0AAE0ICG5_9PEZI|nr:hypothetical protein B0H66DRAFT_210441 [Apodospora peruviana]